MSPLQVVREAKEEEADRSFWKAIIIAAFAGLFLFLAISSFNKFLVTVSGRELLWSLTFGVLFFVPVLLQVFFVKSRWRMTVLVFLETAVALLAFYRRVFGAEFPLYLVLGAAVFFLALLTASWRGQGELENGLTVRFWSVSRRVLPRAVGGFLLYLTVIFYLNYFVWGNFNESLSRRMVSEALAASRPVVKLILSVDFVPTGPVGNFLDALAESELRRLEPGALDSGVSDIAIDFQRLPKDAQQRAVETASAALAKELQKFVGAFQTTEKIEDVVFRFAKNYVTGLSPSVQSSLRFIAAILFFFTLKGVALLLYWFIGLIGFIIFKFLLISGFAYITVESRGREFVMLS